MRGYLTQDVGERANLAVNTLEVDTTWLEERVGTTAWALRDEPTPYGCSVVKPGTPDHALLVHDDRYGWRFEWGTDYVGPHRYLLG